MTILEALRAVLDVIEEQAHDGLVILDDRIIDARDTYERAKEEDTTDA